MKNLFVEYENAFNKLKEKLKKEQNLPRTLRLFDIRLRLSIDLIIDFKKEVSLTKTPVVKNTYIRVFQLLEKWNVYEAFVRYFNKGKKELSVFLAIPEELFDKSGCREKLEEICKEMKELYLSHEKNMNEYFERISGEKSYLKSGKLKEHCNSFYECLKNDGKYSYHNFLSLIYAERNMYYHSGEASRIGTNYKLRQKILDIYNGGIIFFIFKLATYVLNQKAKS